MPHCTVRLGRCHRESTAPRSGGTRCSKPCSCWLWTACVKGCWGPESSPTTQQANVGREVGCFLHDPRCEKERLRCPIAKSSGPFSGVRCSVPYSTERFLRQRRVAF